MAVAFNEALDAAINKKTDTMESLLVTLIDGALGLRRDLHYLFI